VAIPAGDPLSTRPKAASASIFVRYREPAVPVEIGPLIRAVVARAIEGLDPERVSIAFTPATNISGRSSFVPVSWMGLWVDASSLRAAMLMVLVPWATVIAVGVAALYRRFGRPSRLRSAEANQPQRGPGRRPVLRSSAEAVK
jgi:type III secretory pathway lipoprotein EscJ